LKRITDESDARTTEAREELTRGEGIYTEELKRGARARVSGEVRWAPRARRALKKLDPPVRRRAKRHFTQFPA